MSEQNLNLKDDWDRITTLMKNRFPDENLEIGKDFIRYKGGTETLEIQKNGRVLGEMPLHKAEIKNIREVEINDSGIKFISDSSKYIFRG